MASEACVCVCVCVSLLQTTMPVQFMFICFRPPFIPAWSSVIYTYMNIALFSPFHSHVHFIFKFFTLFSLCLFVLPLLARHSIYLASCLPPSPPPLAYSLPFSFLFPFLIFPFLSHFSRLSFLTSPSLLLSPLLCFYFCSFPLRFTLPIPLSPHNFSS